MPKKVYVYFLCFSLVNVTDAFQQIPGQTQYQDAELKDYKFELEELQKEVSELKKQSFKNKDSKENKVEPREKIYDENFDCIKEAQEKQRKISEEFSEQLPCIIFPEDLNELNSLKEIALSLPKELTRDSMICDDLKKDIEDLNELYGKLRPLLRTNVALLHIVNYLAFNKNDLISRLVDKFHNVVLSKSEAELLLEDTFGNIKNFSNIEDKNFVNAFVSKTLKLLTSDSAPSYFIFQAANIICEEITSLKGKLKEILPEFFRKFKSTISNVNGLIEIMKKKKDAENIEIFIKIVERYFESIQKTDRELESESKNLSLWIDKSFSIWEELIKKRKNDKILGLIRKQADF